MIEAVCTSVWRKKINVTHNKKRMKNPNMYIILRNMSFTCMKWYNEGSAV